MEKCDQSNGVLLHKNYFTLQITGEIDNEKETMHAVVEIY